jgi:hypothetical protein
LFEALVIKPQHAPRALIAATTEVEGVAGETTGIVLFDHLEATSTAQFPTLARSHEVIDEPRAMREIKSDIDARGTRTERGKLATKPVSILRLQLPKERPGDLNDSVIDPVGIKVDAALGIAHTDRGGKPEPTLGGGYLAEVAFEDAGCGIDRVTMDGQPQPIEVKRLAS